MVNKEDLTDRMYQYLDEFAQQVAREGLRLAVGLGSVENNYRIEAEIQSPMAGRIDDNVIARLRATLPLEKDYHGSKVHLTYASKK